MSEITSATEAGRSLSNALAALVGPAAFELGHVAGDWVRLWRFRNQMKILDRAREYCQKAGVPFSNGSRAFLVPLIEAGGDVEDPELQDLFARLLAGGMRS